MSAAQIHASDPNWWLGTLAATMGHYLKGSFTDKDLAKAYNDYRQSPAVDDELRALLPEPSKRGKP